MSNQLQVPCLGRPFNLGMLYDSCTQKHIVGTTLWTPDKLKLAKLTTEQPTYKCNVVVNDTFQEKMSCFDLRPSMKLGVMSNLVEVAGAAKFLHDRKSSERKCRVTAKVMCTTHCDQLTMDQLGDMQFPHELGTHATHVVTGLIYGADAFFVFDRSIREGETAIEASSNMEATVKKFFGADASCSVKTGSSDKTETKDFQCKFYGDFIPESNPTTFDEALEICKDLPNLLTKSTQPKLAYLMPLTELRSCTQVVHPISLALVSQVENIMEHFHLTEIRAKDLQRHDICHKFVDIENQLSTFVNLLSCFKEDFADKLSKIIPRIRSTGAESDIQNLTEQISSVDNSPFNPTTTENYLKSKDSEIKKLAQLLKNMEKYSKIQYDFPGTQCDLITLSNDNELAHVVCFAFNVTSKTCGYLENLKSYLDGVEKELADTDEWFDKPDDIEKLNLEIEKFERLSSTTQDGRTAYVVTSSSKDASKFDPLILVYTRDNPMRLGLPGSPQASKVTIDSITLTWTPPVHGNVESYKVLYRSTEETDSEFIAVNSQGHLATRHIKDLSHGVEYEFKIQATTTADFKIQGESSCIKTTEYYDIVLIGKTGQGKSTLGNKLLEIEKTDESQICLHTEEEASKKRFTQANEVPKNEKMLSVTGRCKLMSNEKSKIRVLDVPGFSDSGTLKKSIGENVSVYKGNLQIVRWVVREQIQSQLKVRRILYFLPVRGSLEKADGTLQEELKVLHHYFGLEIFNCMVVVATNSPKPKHQKLGFDDDEREETAIVFHEALKEATGSQDIGCPPVIHILLNDSSDDALSKICSASILKESILPLQFSKDVCAKCSFKIYYTDDDRVFVVDADGKSTAYAESKCHPLFIQRYGQFRKIVGGVGHIATFGFGLLVSYAAGIKGWPGFTNADEMCISCEKSPGSEGCLTIGETIVKDNKVVKVDHKNKLQN